MGRVTGHNLSRSCGVKATQHATPTTCGSGTLYQIARLTRYCMGTYGYRERALTVTPLSGMTAGRVTP